MIEPIALGVGVGTAAGLAATSAWRWLSRRFKLRRIKVGVGGLGVEFEAHELQRRLTAMEQAVHEVVKSVNNVGEGAPPLTERMSSVERSIRYSNETLTWMRHVVLVLVHRLGGDELARMLPPPPPEPPELKVEVSRG